MIGKVRYRDLSYLYKCCLENRNRVGVGGWGKSKNVLLYFIIMDNRFFYFCLGIWKGIIIR